MKEDAAKLSPSSAGFGLAAALVTLFNTAIACAKDADKALLTFMNGIAGHNWTTQAIADLVLFVVLGFVFAKSGIAEKMAASRLTALLTVAVVVAGGGLFLWYVLF